MSSTQYYISSEPRHLRYMFFIDENFSMDDLWEIADNNLFSWGGRYNPIIPIGSDGKISAEYEQFCKHFDPDYIFYSSAIDPGIIKNLGYFQTSRYYEIQMGGFMLDGIGVLNLLNLFEPKLNLVELILDSKKTYPLQNFLKINFGIVNFGLMWQRNIAKKHNQIVIDEKNYGTVVSLLAYEEPVNIADLSFIYLHTNILKSDELETGREGFEIIITENINSKNDFLYFWNRKLYESPKIFLITTDEIESLLGDESFGRLISNSISNLIELVSFTVTPDRMLDYLKRLNNLVEGKKVKYKTVTNFPYKVSSVIKMKSLYSTSETQILFSEQTLYSIPKLNFDPFYGKFASDVTLKKLDPKTNQVVDITYPKQLNIQSIFPDHRARINKSNQMSVIFQTRKIEQECTIRLITFNQSINYILTGPWYDGTSNSTEIFHHSVNDSGTKLAALIKLFDNNLSVISEFFFDKFWLDLFFSLCTSKKEVGNTVTFEEIFKSCFDLIISNGIEIKPREKSNQNPENLTIGLKNTLLDLCRYKVLLQGYKIKCPNCTSQFWYHIDESKEILRCKGCVSDFSFPIEPSFSYKLNDLVKNNLYLSDGISKDGNLTVLKTLCALSSNSRTFEYTPQINLYKRKESSPFTDLDIFCVVDGRIYIGEAKTLSSEFKAENNKCLINLVEIAKSIRPDVIILSCNENANNNLENAVKSLTRLFNHWEFTPEIRAYELQNKSYENFKTYRYFYH